jgi:adenine/guanine phosphoribosyltransferase-like PRPP-binding protein
VTNPAHIVSPSRPEDYRHASHMFYSIRPSALQDAINASRDILKKYTFDAFAFRGMSGALLAAPFALAFDKGLILVRKENDNSHSRMLVEGMHTAKQYVIIDDFIASGATIRAILKDVEVFAPEAVCIGVLEICEVVAGYDRVEPHSFFIRRPGKLTELSQQLRQLK